MQYRTLLIGGVFGIGAFFLGGYKYTGAMLKMIANNNNINVAEAALLLEGRHPQFGNSHDEQFDVDGFLDQINTEDEWESSIEEVINDLNKAAEEIENNQMFEDPFQ